MSNHVEVDSVTELPKSGHERFVIDEETFSIDKMNNGQWLVHSGVTPLATIHHESGEWRVSGANDLDPSQRFASLPEALTHASSRY